MRKPEQNPKLEYSYSPQTHTERSPFLHNTVLRSFLAATALVSVVPSVAMAQDGNRPLSANRVFDLPLSANAADESQNYVTQKHTVALRAVSATGTARAEFAKPPLPKKGNTSKKGKVYVHCDYNLYYPRNIDLQPFPFTVEGRLRINKCKNIIGNAVKMTSVLGIWHLPVDDSGEIDKNVTQPEATSQNEKAGLFTIGTRDEVWWPCIQFDSLPTPQNWATSVVFSALSAVPEDTDRLVLSTSTRHITQPRAVTCTN